MSEQLLKLFLLPALFGLGMVGSKLGVLRQNHADQILTWLVNGIIPALILGSLLPLPMQQSWSVLPVCAALIVIFLGGSAWMVLRVLALAQPTQGSFIVASMIMNVSVIYPYLAVFDDDQSIGLLAVFDFGQALLVFTLVYAIACAYGKGPWHSGVVLRKLASFPPNIALASVIFLKSLHISLPHWAITALLWTGKWGVFTVLIALGIYFSWHRDMLRLAVSHILARVSLGAGCAFMLQHSFSLSAEMTTVVWIAATAPLGFNAIVFAEREHLDKTYAATVVSLSMLMGLIYIPLILLHPFW